MGRASRAKQERRRDRASLLENLHETLDFLQHSADAFDHGHTGEAKRLAVCIRALVHDTGASHSLLEQLGVKKQIQYLDTAGPMNPDNLLDEHNLVGLSMGMSEDGSSESRYFAMLGDGPPDRCRKLPFDAWWGEPVMRVERTWTRKELVLLLANREGGAHVDPNLNDEYQELAKRNRLGWVSGFRDSQGRVVGEETAFEGDAVAISVRQIAYELKATLESFSLDST